MANEAEATQSEVVLAVSDFVALANQIMRMAFPSVTIRGEIANFKISKNKWVYFDLKDEMSSVRFFGTVYQLNGPLEDGLVVVVRGVPALHKRYGFSISVQNIMPEGEGTIRRAADLLHAKLEAEGLFSDERKRRLPYPPSVIGLVTSRESAAYGDFIKILNARWRGITVKCIDVQVQGEAAPAAIISAIERLNRMSELPEIIVVIRGGGSPEDFYAFSTEPVTRAIAGSRIPTLVAIGHENDISLAELAADLRASTPSNAAELIVPDRQSVMVDLRAKAKHLKSLAEKDIVAQEHRLSLMQVGLGNAVTGTVEQAMQALDARRDLIEALNPRSIVRRGYAIVRYEGTILRSESDILPGAIVDIELSEGSFKAARLSNERVGNND